MTNNTHHAPRNFLSRSPGLLISLAVLALLLTGCMLVSGQETSEDTQEAGGNVSTVFVSAEGAEERSLSVGSAATLNVIASVTVDQGDLRLEVLNPDGSVACSAISQPRQNIVCTSSVATDEQGRLRYRVAAREARNGSFQLLYQRP